MSTVPATGTATASTQAAHTPVYDAVVFDCDGVIVDSEGIALEVTLRIVTELGWQTDIDTLAKLFVGSSSEYYHATLAERVGRPLEPGWDAPYKHWLDEAFAERLQAIPGIVEALDRLTVPFALASNSRNARIRSSLDTVGLRDRFEGRICSAEDEAAGKPAPDVYLSAARKLGVDPARCIAVDDSPTGVLAAERAGMLVLAYTGHFGPEEFPQSDRVIALHDMRELPRVVEQLRFPERSHG